MAEMINPDRIEEIGRAEAVLFDMDGLMFDTERLSGRFWHQAGLEQGLKIEEDYLLHVRGSNSEGARLWFERMYGVKYDYAAIRSRRTELFRGYLDTHPIPAKEGLTELLGYLEDRGMKIALATSTAENYAMQYLRSAGVHRFFDIFVCGDMVSKCKPDPEIFLKAAKGLGKAPGRCLVLEDSLNGILAAYEGGFVPIMVPDIMQPGEELLEKLAAKCGDLLQVRELLRELENGA